MGYQFKIGMLQQTRATFAEKTDNIHRANMQVTWEKVTPRTDQEKFPDHAWSESWITVEPPPTQS